VASLSIASGAATTRLLAEVMANTRLLTEEVENFVREALARNYGQPFGKRVLPLPPGGRHEFDAVSADGLVVASVKSSSGRTASGRHPAGKVNAAVAELYFLSLIPAPTRLLILTTPEFHDIFIRTLAGKIASGIQIVLIELPASLQQRVNDVQQQASLEVTPVLDTAEQQIMGTTE